eukprot:6233018-Amphidinium_carterae.1
MQHLKRRMSTTASTTPKLPHTVPQHRPWRPWSLPSLASLVFGVPGIPTVPGVLGVPSVLLGVPGVQVGEWEVVTSPFPIKTQSRKHPSKTCTMKAVDAVSFLPLQIPLPFESTCWGRGFIAGTRSGRPGEALSLSLRILRCD